MRERERKRERESTASLSSRRNALRTANPSSLLAQRLHMPPRTPVPRRPPGWAYGRDASGHITVDPKFFPSGIAALAAHMNSLGLGFGLYTDRGPTSERAE